uniref:Uncharacterized protein n=1 Tax=Romanomermis culicivorax TaxID=13658 RepID=A0A915J9L9_ROMCU
MFDIFLNLPMIDHDLFTTVLAKELIHGFRTRSYLWSFGRDGRTFPDGGQWWDSSGATHEALNCRGPQGQIFKFWKRIRFVIARWWHWWNERFDMGEIITINNCTVLPGESRSTGIDSTSPDLFNSRRDFSEEELDASVFDFDEEINDPSYTENTNALPKFYKTRATKLAANRSRGRPKT